MPTDRTPTFTVEPVQGSMIQRAGFGVRAHWPFQGSRVMIVKATETEAEQVAQESRERALARDLPPIPDTVTVKVPGVAVNWLGDSQLAVDARNGRRSARTDEAERELAEQILHAPRTRQGKGEVATFTLSAAAAYVLAEYMDTLIAVNSQEHAENNSSEKAAATRTIERLREAGIY